MNSRLFSIIFCIILSIDIQPITGVCDYNGAFCVPNGCAGTCGAPPACGGCSKEPFIPADGFNKRNRRGQ
uniref:ShKT domain-containing protein n=1 Tax=Globodera pallida TaxID=36090 RepID=A0A183C798_GLOPA